MNNIHKLPVPFNRFNEAADWVAKIDRGLNSQESLNLESWLEASPENAGFLIEAAGFYDRLGNLSELAEIFPEQKNNRFFPALSFRGKALALVLIFGVVIGIVSVFAIPDWARDSRDLVVNFSAEASFETAVGEQSSVTLPDGTLLALNTDTLIHMKYTAAQRTLAMERGEVNVRVAHDKTRPLKVFVAGKFVQAVGTAFNVQVANDRSIELIVTEGKVLVGESQRIDSDYAVTDPLPADQTPSHIVASGQELLLDAGYSTAEPRAIRKEDIDIKLSWQGGDIVFRGEPLIEVLREIERYTLVDFTVEDANLANTRVAGLFKAGDVEGMLATLKNNFGVAARKMEDGRVILIKN